MKKKFLILFSSFLLLFIAACSSNQSESNKAQKDSDTSDSAEMAPSKSADYGAMDNQAGKPQNSNGISDQATKLNMNLESATNKMMIYNANITMETKDYDQLNAQLNELISKYNGYIVESHLNKQAEDNRNATIKLRLPSSNYNPFINSLNNFDAKIITQNTDGQDVTEDFIDLSSRLKAKQKIEARLLSFLDKAEKTEDLIKISQDLERVQEDMEVIEGKMNYLKNQSDFSTITLYINETKVIIPKFEQEELNTWQKAKKTFMDSINGITKFFSFLFIAIIGFSPVLIILGILLILFYILRKNYKSKPTNSDD